MVRRDVLSTLTPSSNLGLPHRMILHINLNRERRGGGEEVGCGGTIFDADLSEEVTDICDLTFDGNIFFRALSDNSFPLFCLKTFFIQ
jgi:hypothetical protein